MVKGYTTGDLKNLLEINKTTLLNWTKELNLKPKRIKKFGKMTRIYNEKDLEKLKQKIKNNSGVTAVNIPKIGVKMPLDLTENTNGYSKYIEKLETDNKEYKGKLEKLETKVDTLTNEIIENNKRSNEREKNYQQLYAMIESNTKLLNSPGTNKKDTPASSSKILVIFLVFTLVIVLLILVFPYVISSI